CATAMTRVAIHGGAVDASTCNGHGSWFNAADVARLGLSPPVVSATAVTAAPQPPPAEPHSPDSVARGTFLKPTSLVVIAWLWIVLGGGWCLSSIPTLL